MSDFINVSGRITECHQKISKNGNPFFSIKFLTIDDRYLDGTTFDNALDPNMQESIDVGYIEKPSQDGRKLFRTFYLPNHVKKEGGGQPQQNQSPQNMNYAVSQAIADHVKQYHCPKKSDACPQNQDTDKPEELPF